MDVDLLFVFGNFVVDVCDFFIISVATTVDNGDGDDDAGGVVLVLLVVVEVVVLHDSQHCVTYKDIDTK